MRTLFDDQREAELLSEAKLWLDLHGYTYWRNHVGGIQRSKAGKKLAWSKNPAKGIPDLMGLLKGQSGVLWACELKTAKGRLGPFQELWFQKLIAAGVKVILARSLEDLTAGLAHFEL